MREGCPPLHCGYSGPVVTKLLHKGRSYLATVEAARYRMLDECYSGSVTSNEREFFGTRKVLESSAAVLLTVASASFAQDLTGFYAGGSMATHSGGHVYDGDSGDPYDLEGPAFGVFAGYMMTSGNLSYGGEIAASRGGVYEYYSPSDTSYKDEYEYTSFIDLKGRLGYSMNSVMLYGTVGLSRGHFVSDVVDSINVNGNLFGLGAEYKVNEKFFVGAEYLRRNYDFYDPFQDSDIEAKVDSLSLRAGISF